MNTSYEVKCEQCENRQFGNLRIGEIFRAVGVWWIKIDGSRAMGLSCGEICEMENHTDCRPKGGYDRIIID